MTETQTLFIDAFKASLKNKQVSWKEPVDEKQWALLFKLAASHHVLPMIYEAVYSCPAAKLSGGQAVQAAKTESVQLMLLQVQKTRAFLEAYKALKEAGAHPVVVKGIILRDLYPKPDLRLSADEDVLIRPEEFSVCDKVLKEKGLLSPEGDHEKDYEIPYTSPQNPLYIELHKYLFPPEQDAYGDFNSFFEDVHENAKETDAAGEKILTMAPSDHLFYLICHAFKHFLHSGFGIRQAADIALFAKKYADDINRDELAKKCKKINADKFAAALFKIGEKYLDIDIPQADAFSGLQEEEIDEGPLFEDILDAGIYGGSSESRKHSSTVTLNAAAAKKKGKRNSSVIRSLFPKAKDLKGRYAYLEKYPVLLPIAWAERIFKFKKETAAQKKEQKEEGASKAMRIGKERTELLKKYGIL